MTPIKIFPDARMTIDLLTDEEAGRLLKGLLAYVNGDEVEMPGREMLVYTMLRAQIERDAASADDYRKVRAENGKKGGRPKKSDCENLNADEKNLKKPKNQVVFSEKPKKLEYDYDYDLDNDHDYEQEQDIDPDVPPIIPPVDADLPSADSPEAYATSNLEHLTPNQMDALGDYIDLLGADVVKHAVDEACGAGAPRWSYLDKILGRYREEGIRSLGDAKVSDDRRRANKARGDPSKEGSAQHYTQRATAKESKVISIDDWEE